MLSLIRVNIYRFLYQISFYNNTKGIAYGFLTALLLLTQFVDAQVADPQLFSKEILITTDTIITSEFTIIPSSVTVNSSSTKVYSTIIRNDRIEIPYLGFRDTIVLNYRTLKENFGESEALLDSLEILKKADVIQIANNGRNGAVDRRFIKSSKLQYSGSFSRGVSFGNSQDLVLNSDFNLQMNGDLGNGLLVRAAISDDNLPIQPEGNTQVLQEFDKVFIEISKEDTKIIAGDYDLKQPKSHFMKYYKKLKGLSITNKTNQNKWDISNTGSFAISRGKFRRQNLETKEGNQGPYKLEGENREVFLQILSGTEKVYADGRKLERGENYDYIVDYNRAEISFTPDMIIAANTRIIVEFEYSTQDYLRSLYATQSSFKKGNWELGFNFYNEQDSKSPSSNLEIDSTSLSILESTGDSAAFRSGIFIPEDNNFENITPYNFQNNILSFAQEISPSSVGANFSNVGSGNGSYNIDGEVGINGRIYTYVGEGLGNYEPQFPLVPPEKKQMMSLSATFEPTDSFSVITELALSNNDINRFSTVNNEDNIGLSMMASVDKLKSISIKKKPWTLVTHAQLELVQDDFQPLNRYRAAEFTRDWNYNPATDKNDQLLLDLELGIKNSTTALSYNLEGFSDKDNYDGLKHIVASSFNKNGYLLNAKADYLNSTSTQEKTEFLRPRILLQKNWSNWTIGTTYESESNERKVLIGNNLDSLNAVSRKFSLVNYFIERDLNTGVSLRADYINRNDKKAIDNIFQQISTSNEYRLSGKWKEGKISYLEWQLALRDYNVDSIYLDQDDPKKTFIGRVDHKLKILSNGLVLNSFFESNSGQEPKLEFQYIEVQRGEGSYTWEDFNEDGNQDINEFRVAIIPQDGAYEKISIFNNEFESTNKALWNESLNITPKKFLKNKNSFVSRMQWTTRVRIDQKSRNEEGGQLFRFINFNFSDTVSLVSQSASVNHSLFFNRGNPAYDLQFTSRSLSNRILQITGYEQRSTDEYYGRIRINVHDKIDALLESTVGTKEYISEVFENQDYDISFYNLTPQLNYRPSNKLRLIASYSYEVNTNIDPIVRTSIKDAGLEVNWRQSINTSLLLKMNFAIVNFDGDNPNSPVGFEMLQGLRDGSNFIIDLNYTRRISTNFDLILSSNFRKSENSRLINTGSAQLRAIF